MLKLYGQYKSRAFRVVWLCKETGIPFEHVNVSINSETATCKEDWYKELNPNGRVPTIDDDGLILWESSAINLYLAEKYQCKLWPQDVTERGRLLQWTFFVTNDIEPDMVLMRMHRQVLPKEKRDHVLADRAEARLAPKLTVLDNHLSENRHFGSSRWDMADFMVASMCYTFFVMRYDLSRYPALEKWLVESLDRPMAREARALRE
jgi:glutathione S-transferase